MKSSQKKPKCTTVIFIIGKLRAGYTLETKYISLVHDAWAKNTKCDVVIQSFVGRCGGYGKNNYIKIFCNISHVKKYVNFINSKFSLSDVPTSGKNITGNKKNPTTNNELFTTNRKNKSNSEDYIDDDSSGSEIDDDFLREKIKRDLYKQEQFRKDLIKLYNGKCIITGSGKPLEAAHIIPHSECNNFKIENGLLLRNDIHKLFDDFDISINPNTLKVEMTKDTSDEDTYKNYQNKKINIDNKYFDGIKANLKMHYMEFLKKQKDKSSSESENESISSGSSEDENPKKEK